MSALTQKQDYLMSFVTGGLFVNESVAVARLHEPGEDWDRTAVIAKQSGAFPVRKQSSAQRSIREIINRLKQLSNEELIFLQEGQHSERSALLWLAACRAYRFVAEFAVEVLNERYLAFQPQITYDDFDAFYTRKAEWSEKLAGLSDTTRAKLRAVLFRLMREADIITPDDRIQGALLSSRLIELLKSQNPKELRYFPGAARQASGGAA